MARKKRDAPLSYRPPTAMREAFAARVASSGLTLNAFITAAVFGAAAPRARRKSSLASHDAATLLAQAARIKDLLANVPALPTDEHALLLRTCRDELAEIRTCLMHVLGRDP